MDKIIQADLFRIGGLSGFRGFIKGIRYPGFRYMYLLRNASNYKGCQPKRMFFEFLKKRYSFKYGFQIPSSTKIGKGFFIGHFGTIVINCEVRIGNNCNIAHGVTIGQANRGKLKGSPTIGDKVWIGTNSVIVGRITIGNNILIAPNSFVNFDIPSNSLVIGNPAKVIAKDNPTEGYINFIFD